MKKLVIFDLDGTLLYTLEDLTDSVNYALRQFNFPQRTVDEVCSFVGNGVQRLVRLSAPENITDSEFDAVYATFKSHYAEHCCEKTVPYNGIKEVLKALKEKGIKIGIVSNKFHSAAKDVCDFYFKDMYDIVMGESETCRRKPYPDGILKILNELNINKEDAVLVGDSEVDIKTAENAGIESIAVLWGFRDKDVLVQNGANTLIENPLELLWMIEAGL